MTGSRIEIVTGGWRRIVTVILAAVAFAISAALTASIHAAAADSPVSVRLGQVGFPASGSATAHAHVVRGIAARLIVAQGRIHQPADAVEADGGTEKGGKVEGRHGPYPP